MISGSVREGSVNSAVIATAASLLAPPARAVIHRGIGDLPHFNPDLDFDPLPPAVIDLRAAIGHADALLFSTPEYAGAMPGALKNLLEWTVGGAETTAKPAGWINPSTSPAKAEGTYASLGTVLEYTDVRLVPDACREIPVPRSLIRDGSIEDDSVRREIARVLAALADSAR